MPFSISLRDEPLPGSSLGDAAMLADIVLGEESDTFDAFIGFWSQADYRRQWLEGIARIVHEVGAHSLKNALVIAWMSAGAWLVSRPGARLTWPGLIWTARAALLVGVIGLVLIFRSRAPLAESVEPLPHNEPTIS